jgi:5S rRNA maturation endonuclease (ribonuclease M5)
LRRDNATTPILVEGIRDRRALEQWGCRGQILVVNDGDSLVGTADRLATEHERIILLPDWDRTGGSIHRRLKEMLQAHAVTCEIDYRRELARLSTKWTCTVDGLPAFLAELRARVGTDGRRRQTLER